MSLIVTLACLVLAHVTWRARADAASVAAADAAYARGALREASRLYLAALRAGDNGHDALVHLHVQLGIVAGAAGAERTARAHFGIALALDPSLAAPPELAGRDRSRFEQERPAHALALRFAQRGAALPRTVSVALDHAPARLVERIELRCGADVIEASETRRASALASVEATLPAECATLLAIAHDAHGNVLLRAEHSTAHATTGHAGDGEGAP